MCSSDLLVEQAANLKNRYGIPVQFEGYPLCCLARVTGLDRKDSFLRESVARCEFGSLAIAIDYEGRPKLCPCMEQPLADVSEIDLAQLWACNDSVVSRRNGHWQPPECGTCSVRDECHGGCPFALNGMVASSDPLMQSR